MKIKRTISLLLLLVMCFSLFASISASAASVTYYPKYTGSSSSLVDGLKAVGVDSSYSNRSKIAAVNGISGYSGTAAQNTKMLNLLKSGKLIKSKTEDVPAPSSSDILSSTALKDAAKKYGLSTSSNAYKALASVNTKYAPKLSAGERKGTLVFLFEGVGNNSSTAKRMNAMCVVVKNGKVVYLNRNSSTIPDYPFSPSKNDGTAMPTLKSGIYGFTTKNHRGSYAALNVTNAKVVRFNSKSSYYNSTSSAINVHRRSSDTIPAASKSWVNSAGCQLVGCSGTSASSEYAKFIQALGIVSAGSRGDVKYKTAVSGKIIIDRTYAASYLSGIGYSAGAIKTIG